MIKLVATLLILAFTRCGVAHADGPDPIETRQAGQDLMASNFSGINAVVAAKGDVKTLEFPAKSMARWFRQFPTQFPKGSEQGHNTKAQPTIWTDPAGFQKIATTMADAADKLARLAKAGDVEGVISQVRVIGDTCGSCHRTYRAR